MVLVNTVNAETQRVHQSEAGCGQAGKRGTGREGERGRCTRSVHRAPGQKDSARGVPSRKRRTGKGSGGSNTKGCFNSLLSSVAEQEEEKVTPPVRNYLANLWRMKSENSPGGAGRGGKMMPRKDKERDEERKGGEGRERSGFLTRVGRQVEGSK